MNGSIFYLKYFGVPNWTFPITMLFQITPAWFCFFKYAVKLYYLHQTKPPSDLVTLPHTGSQMPHFVVLHSYRRYGILLG
jgi:hypothetical protein